MSIRELEEEIMEIEKKRKLNRLKTQGDSEEDDVLSGCVGDCGSCGGLRWP